MWLGHNPYYRKWSVKSQEVPPPIPIPVPVPIPIPIPISNPNPNPNPNPNSFLTITRFAQAVIERVDGLTWKGPLGFQLRSGLGVEGVMSQRACD